MFAPVENILGWPDDAKNRCAYVDWTGHQRRWLLEHSAGRIDRKTRITGEVKERPLDDGRGYITVDLRISTRCPRSRLVELYDTHVSARHLDVGVANGWLLDACRFPVGTPAITLMDLNPDALAAASARLAR